MSTEDDTTGNVGAAGGGAGFRTSGIDQRLVPAINHARSPILPKPQTLAWMTDEVARRYYAGDVMAKGIDDLSKEDWPWIKQYLALRYEMGNMYDQISAP